MSTEPIRRPLVLAVGGGKGGVGKSVMSVNIALSAVRLGARVVLVDADFGSANLHTLLGIDRATPTLRRFLEGEVATLDEVLVSTGHARVDLIRGCVATPGAANMPHARKAKLLRHLARLSADLVVVDCGAGIHFNVVDVFGAADARLLVTSPQLVSIQNAYGFLKASVHRHLGRDLADAEDPCASRGSDATEVEVLGRRIERISVGAPERAEVLRSRLADFEVALFGNQLVSTRDLGVLAALSRMARDFLDVRAEVVGGLLRLDAIHESVSRRRPFVLEAPGSHEARTVSAIAENLLEHGRPWPAVAPVRSRSIRPSVIRPSLGATSA